MPWSSRSVMGLGPAQALCLFFGTAAPGPPPLQRREASAEPARTSQQPDSNTRGAGGGCRTPRRLPAPAWYSAQAGRPLPASPPVPRPCRALPRSRLAIGYSDALSRVGPAPFCGRQRGHGAPRQPGPAGPGRARPGAHCAVLGRRLQSVRQTLNSVWCLQLGANQASLTRQQYDHC